MLLIGNLVSLVGSLLMVSIGFLKDKKKILLVQCLQFGVLAAANLLLGAYAGAVSNSVSILRNLAFFKVTATTPLKVFFIVLQLGLTLAGGASRPCGAAAHPVDRHLHLFAGHEEHLPVQVRAHPDPVPVGGL